MEKSKLAEYKSKLDNIQEQRKKGKKWGIWGSCILTAIYAIIFVIIGIANTKLFYGLFCLPIVFFLFYTALYYMAANTAFFMGYSDFRDCCYNNDIDNYFRSEFKKDMGGCIIGCLYYLIASIFLIPFGWLFWLGLRRRFKREEAYYNEHIERIFRCS